VDEYYLGNVDEEETTKVGSQDTIESYKQGERVNKEVRAKGEG